MDKEDIIDTDGELFKFRTYCVFTEWMLTSRLPQLDQDQDYPMIPSLKEPSKDTDEAPYALAACTKHGGG